MNAATVTPEPLLLIPDLQTGVQFLSSLPLSNPLHAQRELERLIDGLAGTPPATEVFLELLEQSRIPFCFVEEEFAHHYINKPLPLDEKAERAFQQVTTTWRKVARAYALCAQLDAEEKRSVDHSRLALTLHRSIYYTGLVVIEHYRARRELPRGIWLELHSYYASAEAQGVDTYPVPDALDPLERSAHCTSVFVSLLLAELAGPYSLSIRDHGLVRRWATTWAPLVSLHVTRRDEPIPPFVIDLEQDSPLSASTDSPANGFLRCLDTSRLSTRLREVRHQLKHDVSPSEIGLGEDCPAGQCRRLLEHIAGPWSQIRAPRKFRRRAASEIARVSTGFDAMHYFIAGKEFAPPAKEHTQTHREFESLFAFPHMVEPEQTLQIRQEQLGLTCERWEVVNQSVNGFRMKRDKEGKTMVHGQLLAISPTQGEAFLLARINWLMQEGDGSLIAGIEALAGIPQAVAARPLTQTITREPFCPAFVLPAIPAIGVEQSLVLPQGWYRASRIIEIIASTPRRVELQHVLNDGPDFEQVSFIAAR